LLDLGLQPRRTLRTAIGFDPITQADSGLMSLNGFPDGPPVRTGPPMVDTATEMTDCNAILLALLARDAAYG
jgi:crotonobetainyl-CoA:carnitine CoA-transferase CaiB-like acyl-CoA transferase